MKKASKKSERKADVLDILVVLDRSGSMAAVKVEHEDGLRRFVEEQRKSPGAARLTLIQFDSENPCDIVCDKAALADVKDITLNPRGCTPLLDAIGKAVTHLDGVNPDSALLMIVTDGFENASREWSKDAVKKLLADRQAKGWKVLFLGANVDAFAEAGQLGIDPSSTAQYQNSAVSVRAMYHHTSSNLCAARAKTATGTTWAAAAKALNYSDKQRAGINRK